MNHTEINGDAGTRPPANKALLTLAGILLGIPIAALLWVESYARVEPTLAGFPFFIWYQFVWVFVCAGCTFAAYHAVLAARPRRRLSPGPPPKPDMSKPRGTTGRDTGR